MDKKEYEIITKIREGTEEGIKEAYFFFRDEVLPSKFVNQIRESILELDVDHLFNDTFLIFCRNVRKGTFRGDASIKTYFLAIFKNLWRKQLKKEELYKNPGEKTDIAFSDNYTDRSYQYSPEEDLISKQEAELRAELLEKALEELSESCKEFLYEYYYLDMSHEKIAEKRDYSKNSMKVIKHRCLAKLIKIINSKLHPPE